MDREMWEAAQALSSLGLWVKIEPSIGLLTVYRDAGPMRRVEIGQLRFPLDDDDEPPSSWMKKG
jgi:hypothetical protein